MGSGEYLSSEKETKGVEGRVQIYTGPPSSLALTISRENTIIRCWLFFFSFTKDKVSSARNINFPKKKQLEDQGERVLSASS